MFLSLLALALRLPYYQDVPAFTDERNDIAQALVIARGEGLPLTNDPSYIGAFWNYLLAAAFLAGGESLLVPRTVVLVLGLLGVVAAYALGCALGGRLTGLTTGVLLATSSAHIAFTSRVAWSHSTTPLFVTVGVWALLIAVRRPGRIRAQPLVLAGLAWGLAFQSHPTVLALMPGALLAAVWRQPALLTNRWTYAAALGVALVNLNLLVYNVSTGFESISRGAGQAEMYADGEALTLTLYVERVGLLLVGLYQLLGGAVLLDAKQAALLLDPGLWPIAVMAVSGIAWQWRQGNTLPGLLLLSTIVVLPLVNGKYNVVPNGRYLAPLLPVLYACAASLTIDMFARGARDPARQIRFAMLARSGTQAAMLLLVGFLVVHPLTYLDRYYRDVSVVGWTNQPVFDALETVDDYPGEDIPVILDRALNVHHAGWGNGTPRDAFELGLTISRTPYRVADLRNDDNTGRMLAASGRCSDQLVILAPRDGSQNHTVVSRLGLRELDVDPPRAGGHEESYSVYVLPRAPGALSHCAISAASSSDGT